jgi:hypothetical protein
MSKNNSGSVNLMATGTPLLRRNQKQEAMTLEDVAKSLEAYLMATIAQNSEVHITAIYGINNANMLEFTATYADKSN